jgi:TPR repeat protein
MRLVLTIALLLASGNAITADNVSQCLQHFNDAEYDKAVPFCQQAANAGDAACQTVLGEMYDSGQGIEASPVLAAKWWNAASEQGYLPAQNLLALKYYYGGDVFGSQTGWGQDYKKAFELWQLSAYKGAATSQFMLGVLYMDGHGVERNYAEAYAWFNIALQGGNKLATDSLIELSRLITPEQKREGGVRIEVLKTQIKEF